MQALPVAPALETRGARMLRTVLGPWIMQTLGEPDVVEIMLNTDGRLWVDRLGSGQSDTGMRLSPSDGERIIRLVAHHVGAEVHAGSPRVSAELPGTGKRFEGLLPPVATAPCFAARKAAVAVFKLEDYAKAGMMSGAGGPICEPPSRNAETSLSRAAHRPARLRWPMPFWRRSQSPRTA